MSSQRGRRRPNLRRGTGRGVRDFVNAVPGRHAVNSMGCRRKLAFPAWATVVCPNAGEPRGFGEEQVAVKWGGFLIEPGDWITADDDGVLHLPKSHAVEMANRAQDVLEKENRVRHEIDVEGRTLAEVVELYKCEKK